MNGTKVTYTKSKYAQAIGVYSYMPSLPNSFNMNSITTKIGKPVKTFIKANDCKNTYYVSEVRTDGRCYYYENLSIPNVFIEKSIGETDNDLNRKIFEHLQAHEPSDMSYFWYVFDVTFDFTAILNTNKLKFTYDLRHDKQYVYGIGFNFSVHLKDRPNDVDLIWGSGFNDNTHSGYIRK
jgi:hypothetical protein